MADVIDFKEKFKQKLRPKEPESATNADAEVNGEPPPAGQDEGDHSESEIEEAEPEDCPADSSSEEQVMCRASVQQARRPADFLSLLRRLISSTPRNENPSRPFARKTVMKPGRCEAMTSRCGCSGYSIRSTAACPNPRLSETPNASSKVWDYSKDRNWMFTFDMRETAKQSISTWPTKPGSRSGPPKRAGALSKPKIPPSSSNAPRACCPVLSRPAIGIDGGYRPILQREDRE